MSIKKVDIALEEYIKLKMSNHKLILLENGGVDNWDGYEESLFGDCIDETLEQYETRLREELNNV